MNKEKKILLIATYDSFLRSGLAVVENIFNINLDIYIRTTASNQLSKKQLKSIFNGNDYSYQFFFMEEYKKIDYNYYDVVVLSAGNEFIKSFFVFFSFNKKINRDKIITISLFPGVIFGDIDSIASRMNVDILLCNNQIDYNIAEKLQHNFNLDNKILLYGLPAIKELKNYNRKKDKIYFFEQVKIPETYNDRFFLIKKLVEYAKRHPLESIYIKPRIRLNEKTVHINRFPLEKLLEDYSKKNVIPENIFFTYQAIEECFSDMKLGLTISSTVAMEAMYYSIPIGLISDFGIRKDFANQDFLESDCFISFNELDEKTFKVNREWYRTRVEFPISRNTILNNTINTVLNNKRDVRIDSIGLESIEYFNYKHKSYLSKNKRRIVKAIKNPKYLLSVLWNFIFLHFKFNIKD